MMENIKLNNSEILYLIKEKQNELFSVIKDKYNKNQSEVIRSIKGGIYVGFFGKGSRKLQEDFNTSSIVSMMDFDLLKYYYDINCDTLNIISRTHYDMYESGASKEVYEDIKRRVERLHKTNFRNDFGMNPIKYLEKLYRNEITKKEEGLIEVDIKNNDEISNTFNNNFNNIENQNLKDSDLDYFYNKLKKELGTLMIKRYQNEKGFGNLTGKIYNNFYGNSANEIIEKLKNNNIKTQSVYSILDNKHQIYNIAILKTLLDYISTIESELQIRIITSFISRVARNKFIKENKEAPLDNLIKINKKEESITFENDIKEQPSLFDINPVRMRKMSIKDILLDELEKDIEEDL